MRDSMTLFDDKHDKAVSHITEGVETCRYSLHSLFSDV
ncbi:hypothetical protein [Enterococcus phage vB_Efm8_KEN21]